MGHHDHQPVGPAAFLDAVVDEGMKRGVQLRSRATSGRLSSRVEELRRQGVTDPAAIAEHLCQLYGGVPAAARELHPEPRRRGGAGVNEEKEESKESKEEQGVPTSDRETHRVTGGRGDSLQAIDKRRNTLNLIEAVPVRGTFADYVAYAISEWNREVEEGRCPVSRSPLFTFVRYIKAYPWAGKWDAKAAFEAVEANLPGDGPPADRWTSALGVVRDEAETEFYGAWPKIHRPPGNVLLAFAAELARKSPLVLPPSLRTSRPSSYDKFISLAGWLQRLRRKRPILLPVEKVGAMLGVSAMSVSRFRDWAVEDGLITKVADGDEELQGQPWRRRADRFVFDLSRWKQLFPGKAASGHEGGDGPTNGLERGQQ